MFASVYTWEWVIFFFFTFFCCFFVLFPHSTQTYVTGFTSKSYSKRRKTLKYSWDTLYLGYTLKTHSWVVILFFLIFPFFILSWFFSLLFCSWCKSMEWHILFLLSLLLLERRLMRHCLVYVYVVCCSKIKIKNEKFKKFFVFPFRVGKVSALEYFYECVKNERTTTTIWCANESIIKKKTFECRRCESKI